MNDHDFANSLVERLTSFTPTSCMSKQQEPLPNTTPMKERVAKLVNDLPEEIKKEGLSLEYLRSRLSGVTKGKHARADAVGTALRQLGWQRKRYWKQNCEGFQSRWFKLGN